MKKLIITILSLFSFLIPVLAQAQAITFPNRGGTGISTIPTYGQVLVGNSGGTYDLLATSSLGISDGGGGSSTWTTGSSNVINQLINYSNNTTDIPCIGGTATTTCKFFFDPNSKTYRFTGNGTTTGFFNAGINVTAPYFNATGTVASLFPYASTTALTASTIINALNFFATGSTTLQNFTAVNSTTTAATTTNTFATTYGGTTAVISGLVSGGTLATGGNAFVNVLCEAASCNNSQIDPTLNSLLIKVLTNTVATFDSIKGTIPYASTTMITSATASTTNLVISNVPASLLKTSSGGIVSGASNGTDYSLISALSCAVGQHLNSTAANGTFTCSADTGSGGSSGGTWSTTTSNVSGQFINYPNNATDIVNIGSTSTTTAKFFLDPNTLTYRFTGNGTTTGVINAGINVTAPYFNATGTVASIFPYASTTMISAETASSTRVITGAGSASFPSYTFSGDENTGIYHAVAADQFSFGTGGSLRATVSSLGIIVTNDVRALTTGYLLNGSSAGALSTPTYAFLGDTNTGLWSQGPDIVNLTVGGVETFRTDVASTSFPTGNIGFGTTSPAKRISIVAGTTNADGINFGDDTYLFRNAANNLTIGGPSGTGVVVDGVNSIVNVSTLRNPTSGNNAQISLSSNGLTFFRNIADVNPLAIFNQANSGSTGDIAQFKNNNGTVDVITQAGRLGVGTSSPYATLSVVGDEGVVAQQYTATGTRASTLPYASSTALTATNIFSTNIRTLGSTTLQAFTGTNSTTTNATSTTLGIGSLNGLLRANTGAVTTATNGTDYSLISALSCSAGQHLNSAAANGSFTCSADTGSGGGGGSGGTFSTSTLAAYGGVFNNYSNNATDVVEFGGISGTTTSKYWFDPNASTYYLGGSGTTTSKFSAGGVITAPQFNATGTIASIFPYASSTALTAINFFTTNALHTGSTTLQNFTGVNATTTNATTTSQFSSVASSTSLFSTTGNIGTLTAGNLTSGTILATGSTTLQNFTGVNATTTNATTTSLAIKNTASALLQTDANGVVQNYGGTVCTNQFTRSLSALGVASCATVGASDVSLANLTATDGTLTFSGTYNGSTARTIGLNLSNANLWTASTTFQQQTNMQQASSTLLTVSGLSYLTGGFLSLASSTLQNFTGINSTTTNATSTTFATNSLCLSNDCKSAWPSAGGGSYPFVPATTYNTISSGTSTPLWLQGSPYALFASSTSVFNNASTSMLTTNYEDVKIASTSLSLVSASSSEYYINGAWVKVLGRYAYMTADSITASSSLTIIDVSNPSTPKVLGRLRGTDSACIDGAEGFEIRGKYLYVSALNTSSLGIVDISNPTSPKVVSCLTDTNQLKTLEDVVLYGKYALGVTMENPNQSKIAVVDVSDPFNPFIATSTIVYNTNNSEWIQVEGKYLYMTSTHTTFVTVLDLSDPLHIVQAGQVTLGTLKGSFGFAKKGKYGYVGTFGSGDGLSPYGLSVVDFGNPTAPVVVASSTLGFKPWTTRIAGDNLFISSVSDSSIHVYNLSSSTNPTQIGSFRDTTNIAGSDDIWINGPYIYVAANGDASTYGQFSILNIPNITTPAIWAGNIKSDNLENSDSIYTNNLFVNTSANFNAFMSNGTSTVSGLLQSQYFISTTTKFSNIFPYASSTSITVSGAFYNTALTSGNCVQASTGGLLTTTGSACGAGGGGTYPFVPATTFNTISSGTSTPLWLQGTPFSLFASSTSVFTYASSTAFSASNLTSGNCVQATTGGMLTTTSVGCVGTNSKWATTSPTQGVASTAIAPAGAANVGIGTTTPWWNNLLSLATTTGQHASFIGNITDAIFNLRSIGNHFYISTSSPSTGSATTTIPVLDIDATSGAQPYFDFATSSPGTGVLNLGVNPATTNGSTTVFMGKLQWDGYDSAGVRRCSYINPAGALTTQAGACTN